MARDCTSKREAVVRQIEERKEEDVPRVSATGLTAVRKAFMEATEEEKARLARELGFVLTLQ